MLSTIQSRKWEGSFKFEYNKPSYEMHLLFQDNLHNPVQGVENVLDYIVGKYYEEDMTFATKEEVLELLRPTFGVYWYMCGSLIKMRFSDYFQSKYKGSHMSKQIDEYFKEKNKGGEAV